MRKLTADLDCSTSQTVFLIQAVMIARLQGRWLGNIVVD